MNYRWSAVLMVGTLMALPLTRVRADEGAPALTPAPAADEGHHWKHDGEHGHGELGLTDDQKAKLKSIKEAEMKAIKPLWRKQRDLSFKLKDQLDDKASDSDLQHTLAELKSNRESMQTESKRFMSQREAVFTPNQQARMVLMRMRHGEHEGRWGHEHMGMEHGHEGWDKDGHGPHDGDSDDRDQDDDGK